jgi:hypothetical protein
MSVEYIELNMSNYDEDQVSQLNAWGIWASHEIERLQKERAERICRDCTMDDVKWTDERCAQLSNLERVLREVANANSANNFIRRMAEASELAESLLNGPYPSFLLFLNGLAIDEREKHSKAKRLTQQEQDALGI